MFYVRILIVMFILLNCRGNDRQECIVEIYQCGIKVDTLCGPCRNNVVKGLYHKNMNEPCY